MTPENTKILSLGKILSKSGLVGAIVLALIVLPLILWYAWSQRVSIVQALSETAFCVSMVWFLVATMRWTRSFGKLDGSSSARLLFGPLPADPDEQTAWRWGRQCRYAFLAMVLSMGAFAFVLWLRGE